MTIDFIILNLTILLGTIGSCIFVTRIKIKNARKYSKGSDFAKPVKKIKEEYLCIAVLTVISACALIATNILTYPFNVIALLIFIVMHTMVIYNLFSRKNNRIKAEMDWSTRQCFSLIFIIDMHEKNLRLFTMQKRNVDTQKSNKIIL